MVRERDPFGQVLDILRVQVRDGVRPPGAPLIVTDIAKSIRVSPTPVREALCHLSGEGLVEVHRGRGFSVHPLEAEDLTDLYTLHALLLDDALSRKGAFERAESAAGVAPEPPASLPLQWRAKAEHLFSRLVFGGGNRACADAMRHATDKLAITRLVENDVLGDVGKEIDRLDVLGQGDDRASLAQALGAYHRRRLAATRPLAAAVRERFRLRL